MPRLWPNGRQREFNPRDVKQEIAPGPCGLRGSLPPQAAQEIAARVLAARRGSSNGVVRQFVIQNRKEEQKESMAIIKAPPKQPKTITIQARVEESVKAQLDRYAEFIDSSTSYVITEALKLLFKRDDEFKAWLGRHASNPNQEQHQGEALRK